MIPYTLAQRSDVPTRMIGRLLVIFVGMIFILKLSSYAAYALIPLVFHTLTQKRTEFAFFVLMLLVSLAITNPVLITKDFHFYMASRGCLFLLAVGMTVKAGFKKSIWFLSPFYLLIVYILYMMVVSLLGWCPIVSELKAILFLVFFFALMQGTSGVAQTGVDIRHIRAGMLVVSVFYILGSLAVYPFPSIGRSMLYLKYEWGGADPSLVEEINGLFNGLTWHSQCLGPTVAMLNAFLLSDYLCNIKRRNRLYLVLLAAVPLLIYMTSSRTAMFAYLISIGSTVFFFMGERRASGAKKSQVLVSVVACALLALLFLAVRPGGFTKLEAFLRKTQDVENMDRSKSLSEDITGSRMGAVDNGITNFKKSPMVGNGFQVSEEMSNMEQRGTAVILSAPIEKGVLPVMILEEGGVFGALFFGMFLVALYAKYRKLQFTCFLSTFTVFIALNSGEAIFFSTSGGGGILWMTCFSALLMDIQRHRNMLTQANPMMMAPMRRLSRT